MTATLKPAIPSGGILSQHVESDFSDYVAGRPLNQRVAIVVLQAGSVGADTLERGRVNKVKYETVHMVEVTDPHEADKLRHQLTQIRASRGLERSQPALFDLSETEQCESLIDQIKDWASEQDIPIGEIDQKWVTYYGGPEHANSETVQACRSVLLLREFAYHLGVIPDAPAGETSDDDEELDGDE